MAITVYGITASRAFRTLWMLEELGLAYTRVPVDHRTGETRTPEHLARNPNGHIPVLDDDGLVLWESMAINLYLADRYAAEAGAEGLWPATPAERGQAAQWSLWVMTEMEAPLLQVLRHRHTYPAERRDPAQADEAEQRLQAPLAVLEGALAGRAHLLGEGFTVADLNVAAVMAWARWGKVNLAPFPNVKRWLDACLDRPARKRVPRDTERATG